MENPNNRKCPLCIQVLRGWETTKLYTEFDCVHCGRYSATPGILSRLSGGVDVVPTEDRFRLSWLVCERTARNDGTSFTEENLADLIREAPSRGDIDSHCDFVLLTLERRGTGLSFDKPIRVTFDEFPAFRTQSPEEMSHVFNELKARGWVSGAAPEFKLLGAGRTRLKELHKSSAASSQAFVAMSLRPDMLDVFASAIEPALIACGYRAKLVGYPANDERTIDDEIISGIRSSSLVIADLTHQRPNVYFEAGYAMGRDIPVIRTMRQVPGEDAKPHFDLEHYPVHRWKDAEHLRQTLENHIKARYLRPSA